MSDLNWLWIVIIGVCVGVYYLHKQGKLPWLKGIRLPKLFEPEPDELTAKLKARTEKEEDKAVKLQKVLEAKRGLAEVQADNIRLQKDIDAVNERSVGKDRQKAEQDKLDAEKAKPKRL